MKMVVNIVPLNVGTRGQELINYVVYVVKNFTPKAHQISIVVDFAILRIKNMNQIEFVKNVERHFIVKVPIKVFSVV